VNPVTCLPAIHVCALVGLWRGQRGIVLRWTQVQAPARVDVMLESGRRVSFPMAILALQPGLQRALRLGKARTPPRR
jgi:hypothetical protein